jgi:peptide/nickel transport system substrate-binding protein
LLRILWHSTGFQNSNGYNNPEVDRLLDQAAGIYDTAEAAELYHEAERIIVEDASYVFIQAPAEFAVVRNEVGGFVYYPDLVLRLRNMWLNTPM